MTAAAQEALHFVREHFLERRKVQRRLQKVREEFHALEIEGWESGARLHLTHTLEGLRDHVAMLFALEEADGYLVDELQEAPRLCGQAEALQTQHRRLFEQLCELAEQADRIIHHPRFVHLLENVEEKFEALDADFSAHEMAEAELMLRAFDSENGEEDVAEREMGEGDLGGF